MKSRPSSQLSNNTSAILKLAGEVREGLSGKLVDPPTVEGIQGLIRTPTDLHAIATIFERLGYLPPTCPGGACYKKATWESLNLALRPFLSPEILYPLLTEESET